MSSHKPNLNEHRRGAPPVRKAIVILGADLGCSGRLLGRPCNRPVPRRRKIKAVVRSGAHRRSLLGEGESRQGPTGTDMLTSAFAVAVGQTNVIVDLLCV
jgi:hypothetical protein